MLPIVLVLLVASSALAAPQIRNVRQVSDNAIPGPRDNTITARALNLLDGGDINFYTLNVEESLKDLARNPKTQAQAYGQTIALLGELATGRSGDSCAAAALINAYASGKPGAIRNALAGYIQQISNNIDFIVKLITNPESVRFATGTRGGCANEGRIYNFELAWDRVRASTPASSMSLIDEEFCTAKRLYKASSASSNNIGAQITASALPPTVQVYRNAERAIINLLQAIASRSNAGSAAAVAKQALISSVNIVVL